MESRIGRTCDKRGYEQAELRERTSTTSHRPQSDEECVWSSLEHFPRADLLGHLEPKYYDGEFCLQFESQDRSVAFTGHGCHSFVKVLLLPGLFFQGQEVPQHRQARGPCVKNLNMSLIHSRWSVWAYQLDTAL